MLYYLTVFVHTKTSIHFSVGGQWWIFTNSHLHFGEWGKGISQFPGKEYATTTKAPLLLFKIAQILLSSELFP